MLAKSFLEVVHGHFRLSKTFKGKLDVVVILIEDFDGRVVPGVYQVFWGSFKLNKSVNGRLSVEWDTSLDDREQSGMLGLGSVREKICGQALVVHGQGVSCDRPELPNIMTTSAATRDSDEDDEEGGEMKA